MIVFFMTLLLNPFNPTRTLGATTDPTQAGTDLGAWVRDRLGTTKGIKERSANPLTNNGTTMSTLDDATTFDAQLTCPSTQSFVSVTASAWAGFGDLSPMTIQIDRDMDGAPDFTFSSPTPISGVCGNGVISCSAGTWTGCSYYTWQVDSSINLSLSPTLMTNLGGCYCINNSCGAPSTTLLPKILTDLGGGISAAIQARDPKYTITDTTISGNTIQYYGKDSANCSTVSSTSGSSSPEQYFGNPTAIAPDTSTEISIQSSDPNSYYSLMTGTMAASTASSSYQTCGLDRIITVTSQTGSIGNGGAGTLCSDHFVYIRAHEETPTRYHLQYLDTGPGGDGHRNCGGTGTGGGVDDWHTLEIVNLPAPPTSFNYCMNPTTGTCPASGTACVTTKNTSVNVMTCHGSGEAYPPFNYNYLFNYVTDTISETINNGCIGLDADPKCQLREETMDSVQTYVNYQPTRITPLSSCKTFTGALGNYVRCRNWWDTDRTYRCETNLTFDFSDAKTRAEVVTGNVSNNPSSFYYEDLRKDGSTWTSENSTFAIPATTPPPVCELACKTSRPTTNTNASISGTTSQFRTSTAGTDYFYKSCPIVSGTPSCPIEPGETLEADCQCQNDFLEAATMMEVLESAGEDTLCEGTTNPATGICSGQIRIFGGERATCRPSGSDTGFFNCCSNGSSSPIDFLKHCKASERTLNDARDNGQTHHIGSQCIRSIPLIGCVQNEEVYCSFNGKLGRIIHEQGRPQLLTYGPTGDWRTPPAPNCSGFLPEDLQMIDFSQIDLSEFFGDITTKTQTGIESDMSSEVNDFYNNLRP